MSGELTEQLQLAKSDRASLNALLREYTPFIKKCVSSQFFRPQERRDYLTEAMLAFASCVRNYEPNDGAFIPYARVAIRNRLIDCVRKEKSVQRRRRPITKGIGEGDSAWEADLSQQVFDRIEEENNLRVEIAMIDEAFSEWGFDWARLLKCCPKQERSRALCQRIARYALRDREIVDEMLETHRLPIGRLSGCGGFPRKALEKYRHYIVALILISKGDYPFVYSFIPQSFEGGDTE